jgi:chemotaxis protein CheD
MTQVTVGIADLAVGTGDLTLVTIGLGSCVAIVLHDAVAGVGGLAHVLLPHAALTSQPARVGKVPTTAIPVMLERMRALGARGPIEARLVGGASMFAPMLPVGSAGLGVRNVKAAREACVAHGVPVVGERTGGSVGRSVAFDVATGRVHVSTVLGDDVEL